MDDVYKLFVSFATLMVLFMLVFLSMIYYMSIKKDTRGEYLVVGRHVDKDKSANILADLESYVHKIIGARKYEEGSLGYYAMKQLRNYRRVEENDRIWKIGHKAETRKMRDISITLREKDGKFIDRKVIDFVFLHELAHVATPKSTTTKNDHSDAYWNVFGMLLDIAKEKKIYTPVNYAIHPKEYCDTKIIYNPWYSNWKKEITKPISFFEK